VARALIGAVAMGLVSSSGDDTLTASMRAAGLLPATSTLSLATPPAVVAELEAGAYTRPIFSST